MSSLIALATNKVVQVVRGRHYVTNDEWRVYTTVPKDQRAIPKNQSLIKMKNILERVPNFNPGFPGQSRLSSSWLMLEHIW